MWFIHNYSCDCRLENNSLTCSLYFVFYTGPGCLWIYRLCNFKLHNIHIQDLTCMTLHKLTGGLCFKPSAMVEKLWAIIWNKYFSSLFEIKLSSYSESELVPVTRYVKIQLFEVYTQSTCETYYTLLLLNSLRMRSWCQNI